jgi:hypothetical protein
VLQTAVVVLMVAFALYERWRFRIFEIAASREPAAPGDAATGEKGVARRVDPESRHSS